MLYKLVLFCGLFVSTLVHAEVEDKLAYLSFTGEYWQAYVLSETGEPAKKVTSTNFDISVISWLENGREIFICGLQGETGIININNGGFTKIRLPHDNTNDAVISRDGKKIVYSIIPKGSNDNKLFYYDLNSKKSYPLYAKIKGRQYDPKFSKDGNTVYFISGESNLHYDIVKGDIVSGTFNVIVENEFYNFDVDISDAGEVTYSSNVSGAYNLWTHIGGNNFQLTDETYTNTHPSISGDSERLYYERIVNGVTTIWTKGVASNNKLSPPRQITSSKTQSRYPAVYKGNY